MGNLSSKQFILSGAGISFPDALHRAVGGFELSHSPDLPAVDVAVDGEHGTLLGWPLHLDGRTDITRAEYDELGGRYLFISATRVLHDPLGSYGVVYSPDLETAASTSALLPQDRLVERSELNAFLDIPAKKRWYPFGLTPYENVHRLQPNHSLDLDRWRVERRNLPRRTEGNLDVIVDGFTASMDAIKQLGPAMIGMTSGNETRMLLAGLRGHQDLYSFTFATANMVDTNTGRALAKLERIPHDVIEPRRDPAVSQDWFNRVGRSVTGQSMTNAASKEDLPRDRWFVKGMGGEIGRGFYYADGDTPSIVLTAEDLLGRMKLPVHPVMVEAGTQWVSRLDPEDSLDLLDMLFTDNRMGCWSIPQMHGDTDALAMVFPLNKVSVIRAIRGLPEDVRFNDRFAPLVVEQIAPDLMRLPINEPFGAARLPWLAKRAVRRVLTS
jgi:hypothetical protein